MTSIDQPGLGKIVKVSTGLYRRAHDGQPPTHNQYGTWKFKDSIGGLVGEYTSTYGHAMAALPAGEWQLLP